MQGVNLPDSLRATGSMDELIEHTEVFLMVVPTPFVAATMKGIKDKIKPHQARCLMLDSPADGVLGCYHHDRAGHNAFTALLLFCR